MKKIVGGLFLMMALSSCEKDVDFDLNESTDVLVVDANIESGQPPIVLLTRSLNYFSSISAELLANTFVHHAVVTISNGTLTHQLKEYATNIAPGIDIYTYRIDSTNLSTAFIGEFNKTYSLKILSAGKEYISTTTIPILAKKPDSLWWKKAPVYEDEDTTRVILMGKATDPPGLGNYVRYFTKRNSEPFLPGENSVFDDQVIDGSTYELQIQPGIDLNNPVAREDNYFNLGDTITFKLCNIDKSTYTFWNTWEFAFRSIGNPFAQPGKVIGNISNGALGAFYGYAAFFKTIIVPR